MTTYYIYSKKLILWGAVFAPIIIGLGTFFLGIGIGQWLIRLSINLFNLPFIQVVGTSFYYPLLLFAIMLFIPERVFQTIMTIFFKIMRGCIVIFDNCTFHKFENICEKRLKDVDDSIVHKDLFVYTNIVRTIKIACLALFFIQSLRGHHYLFYNVPNEEIALFVGISMFMAAIALSDTIKEFWKSVSEKLALLKNNRGWEAYRSPNY